MQINGYEFTIGADPEIFVARGGKPVSAFGLIPGDKKAPHKVRKGAVQVDGMALEFNIDPAKTMEEFTGNLNTVMTSLKDMVPGYDFYEGCVAEFGADYIKAQPEEARILGCEPDYNAYTKAPNPRPNADTPFRTASGHIHIGWTKGVDPLDKGHFEACCSLAKALDLYLGVPSFLWDKDTKRRQLYGAAGCFRPKPYGMEYRTLSNRWLAADLPHLRSFVYANTIVAITETFKDEKVGERDTCGVTARQIIDGNLVDKANTVLNLARRSEQYKLPSAYRAVPQVA